MKRKRVQRLWYRSPYPFSVLGVGPRAFLNALRRTEVLTIGQAFRCCGLTRTDGHAAIERWLEDPAFVDALFFVLRRCGPPRGEQVLTTICEFLHKQPIRRICDIPNKPRRALSGWRVHAARNVNLRNRKLISLLLSKSEDQPWN